MSAPAETRPPVEPNQVRVSGLAASSRWALGWSGLRLLAAFGLLAGVIKSLLGTISGTVNVSRQVGHFFSYFTMWSNLLSILFLVTAAIWVVAARPWLDHRRLPGWICLGLAAAVTCMTVTGVVYNALLRPERSDLAPIEWSNEVLHLAGPLFMLVDLVVAPLGRRLPWKAIWAILSIPIVWTVYTLIRGAALIDPASGKGWYPYFFIDPDVVSGGWWGVTVFLLVITVVVAAIAAGVVAIIRRRHR